MGRHVELGSCASPGGALSQWLLHLQAAPGSSALTAAPFPSVLPSSSLAAAGSDKVTASEVWNLLLLQFYFQDCSGSSPLCSNTACSTAKPRSRSSKVLKGPHQDLAGAGTVPLVSGDMGGKKDSIPSTPGAHLWVPAVQGRNRPGVSPFPSNCSLQQLPRSPGPQWWLWEWVLWWPWRGAPSSLWQARGRA